MFKKPKRNFRSRKAGGSDSEEERGDANGSSSMQVENGELNASTQVPPQVSSKPEKKKKSKKKKDEGNKSRTTVSFDHDDDANEDEVFKVKKSSHSKRIAKQLKRESLKEKKEMEQMDEEPEKRKESLEPKLKLPPENGKTSPFSKSQDRDSDSNRSDQSDEEGGRKHAFSRREPFTSVLQSGVIPDANLIHMARKKRQQAREMGDFIPVDDTVRVEKSKSRLVRDDENDKSDSDEDRLQFTIDIQEQEKRQMQDRFLAAEHGSNSDESDQENEWEKQQIQKAVSIPQVVYHGQQYQDGNSSNDASKSYQQMYYGQTGGLFNQNASSGTTQLHQPYQRTNFGKINAHGTPKDLEPISIDSVRKRITGRLEDLSSVHRAHVHEKDDLENRFDTCEANIEKYRGCIDRLENQFRFFQEMRGYVRDLVECLNEKNAEIQLMERQMMQAWKTRAEKMVKRRQEDVKDQSQDYMPGKAVAPPSNGDDVAKQRRAAEREARRARRRRARESMDIKGHHEGLSSDDEVSKSDGNKFKTEKGRIQYDSQTIFDDVVDDFHKMSYIKHRFENWKFQQSESYEEAYIGLCLPKLFTPLIRLKLIQWLPLEDDVLQIDSTRWFESLMFYGHREGEIVDPKDSDIKLLPSIIEKVLLPKITGIVKTIYDPISTSQTRNLVRMLQKFIRTYPSLNADSKNTQALISAVNKRIKRSLDEDVFMPLYPKEVLENKSNPAAMFFHRQFWTSVKLLGNILLWQAILGKKTLQEMSLDSLLNRYLMLGLHAGGVSTETVQKVKAITEKFPKDWFTDLETDSTIPQLENLCRYLTNAASVFDKKSNGVSDSDRKEARDNIRQIMKILVNIHAMDHALLLSNQYSLKLT